MTSLIRQELIQWLNDNEFYVITNRPEPVKGFLVITNKDHTSASIVFCKNKVSRIVNQVMYFKNKPTEPLAKVVRDSGNIYYRSMERYPKLTRSRTLLKLKYSFMGIKAAMSSTQLSTKMTYRVYKVSIPGTQLVRYICTTGSDAPEKMMARFVRSIAKVKESSILPKHYIQNIAAITKEQSYSVFYIGSCNTKDECKDILTPILDNTPPEHLLMTDLSTVSHRTYTEHLALWISKKLCGGDLSVDKLWDLYNKLCK